MTSQLFLDDIKATFQNNQQLIKAYLEKVSETDLNKKANPESWSILECLAHLNIYAQYYQPALQSAIQKATKDNLNDAYKSGWFGKMSIEGIRPSNTTPQKTLKKYNPVNSQLDSSVIDAFWKNQTQWAAIIDSAYTININQRTVPVEFFKLIKMKIGDALCFTIQHEARHIQQILRIEL